jgi:hypothetical protein
VTYWPTIVSLWLTVVVLITTVWRKVLKPLLATSREFVDKVNEILENTKTVAIHTQQLEDIKERLDKIESNTHQP